MDSHTNCTSRLAGLEAVVLAVFLGAVPARAHMITPGSIPTPPPPVGSAQGTLIPSADLVTN